MSTTILRFEKHKHFANLRQAGAHQHRHHLSTPNADPCRTHLNRTFIGSTNLAADVKERLRVLAKPPRKNAVLAMDGMLTLSPELFRSGDLDAQKQTLKRFALAAKRWLLEKFGDNVVNAVLHRDETSPHIHFTVVPIERSVSGQYTLNARKLFNKDTLHDFQCDYFETMQNHFPSLEPPKYKQKTSHTTLKAFYAGLNQLERSMDDFIHCEFHRHKARLNDDIDEVIREHVKLWVEKHCIDVSEGEMDGWVERLRLELESSKPLMSPSVTSSISKSLKQKISLN
ncbi:MobV family relaxase [Vibrio parahaemolyticus]|uniref:MobV family relaxase n=2 Tax=Vibrio parahaemolyticus TaxID=670 RepID=UPI001A29456D|nr:MobV family relaxase [Vibrio parahaemolyticus]MBO0177211.1 plasmid recombination protein [Vibrio parahaemolyticus]MDF5302911.1 MobV family relaxase [Vibrio parahaemolyticus]MDG2574130.1 MobV family relaxase [Vibrio parahaemolyticus]MDG2754299.1 MobV family relaxase [Vibrio parahaemolyticus]HAS6601733.1 hypothetical protein [Vibrio parahaemolyticus]